MRNRLQKLREYSSRQKIVLDEPVDRDIVAFAAEDDDACAVILKVRDGKLVGKQHHYFSGVLQMPAPAILTSIIERHYIGTDDVPEEVLLPLEPGDEDELLERFLTDRRGEGRVRISVPKIADRRGRSIEVPVESAPSS